MGSGSPAADCGQSNALQPVALHHIAGVDGLGVLALLADGGKACSTSYPCADAHIPGVIRLPAELSGGMKKRVGLARALAMQPQMVFYDEPTSGLDPVMTMTISRLIRKTQQTLGVTSVLVTHDMESAYYAADRIAMLYNGRIVQIGTVAEIKNSTNPIVKAFINGTELKEEEKDEQQ